MNVTESPIEVTVTIHFVLTINPTEQYSLAAFAEFLTEQRLESTLLKAIIQSLNDVLIEAFDVVWFDFGAEQILNISSLEKFGQSTHRLPFSEDIYYQRQQAVSRGEFTLCFIPCQQLVQSLDYTEVLADGFDYWKGA